MKTRETKKQQKTDVILSEATDGINRVRLMGTARAEEEEECPWKEIDAYSGRFVVAGYKYDDVGGTTDNYHPWLAYSTDGGEKWIPSTTTSDEDQTHGELQALTYGGGHFVVAGYRYGTSGGTTDNNHPWLAYSTDGGKTWTKSETTANEDQPHGHLRALAYGGGRFVVAGYRYGSSGDTANNYHPWLAYSSDGGETWTPSTTTSDEDQTHGQLYALAYGGGRFVVAGYQYGTDNNHPWIAYSTDGGKTWTKSETTADKDQTHGRLYALAYGGGRFVVAGYRYDNVDDTTDNYHPWLAYSTDGGEKWIPSTTTSDTSQTHGLLYALAYGGGRFVVAGYQYGSGSGSGTRDDYHPWIAYSSDGGDTWTPSTTTGANESQSHGELHALTYAPDSYCWQFGTEKEDEDEEN